MAIALLVVILVNLSIFAGLAAWAVRFAIREDQPRIRILAWALAAIALAFVLGAATRLLLMSTEAGWVSMEPGDFLTSGWQLAQSLAATALGALGVVVLRKVGRPLRDADRIADTIKGRVPSAEEFAAFGLTGRELEVLETIAAGKLSDRDIGESLFIAPGTAGTHVKNILRKTGVSNRRDLVVLAAAARKPAGNRPTGTR